MPKNPSCGFLLSRALFGPKTENGVRLYKHVYVLTLSALASWLVGCSFVSVPEPKPTTGRPPTVAEVPNADETVRGAEDPPIVTLEMGDRLHERRLQRTESLPGSIIVPTTNLNAVPVTAALQAVLAGTDVSLSWSTEAFDAKLVTVTNLSGPLPGVVDKICASAKVFCIYRNGMLELKEKETFIITLPSMPTKAGASAAAAANNTMADTISELSGEKAKLDPQGGNLIYVADVDGHESVREYLSQLRHGRPLVVMQLYIWEVTLDKQNGAGINWKEFNFKRFGGNFQNVLLSGVTGFSQFAHPGVGLGATFQGQVSAEALFQFISTQGQVQTISNPQLTFISGSSAEFRVGGEQRYISQVGQLTNANVSGTNTTNTGIGTNTVSTDSIQTGLTVIVNGNYENGVVFAALDLEIQDIISLNPTTTQGLTINLPETTERKVSTTLRVRPGDNLVLAGLVTSRDQNKREGVPLPYAGRLPTFADDQFKNTELVILVKPSVVLFTDSAKNPEAESKNKGFDVAKPALDAVVIDKDGATTLKLPDSFSHPLKLQAQTDLARPELMAPAAGAVPIGDVPISPSEDGAPVDKRLMQRGFSHAFDELLEPASGSPPGSAALKGRSK